MSPLARLHAFARRHPHAEIATAAVVFAVTLVTTATGPAAGDPGLDAVAVSLAAAASLVLLARQRFPVLVLLASTVAAEAYLVRFEGDRGELILVAPLIALYTVAEVSSRRRSLAIGVLAVLAFAGLHMMVKPSSPLGADNAALAALGGLAVVAGEGSRTRRALHVETERRAQRAEADREADAVRRVTEERLRIARELHDVVGHQLALIHVQAGVATHVLGEPPAPAAEALAHIRTACKAALADLTETVGLLRQPDDRPAPTDPVVGLAGLADLLASFRRTGLTIAERIDGPVRALPPAVDLTAYRVLQESLTNVCKHTGPTDVSIRLAYRPSTLQITVRNAAPGGTGVPTVPGEGHGLVGMRERVAALGGTVRAGRRPDGGFRVSAVLPA